MNSITISIVSHNQDYLLRLILNDLAHHAREANVIITHNLPQQTLFLTPEGLDTRQIVNPRPKGFGSNHNAAFEQADTPFFCVANPDLRLTDNPFPALLDCMNDPQIGLVAPMAVNALGVYDGNARRFPTPSGLLRKLICGDDARYEITSGSPIPVDWAAGMFMLFRSEAFEAIGGFDEGFHLYYEDVDICTRLWNAGWKVMLHPGVQVVHDAQRTSHRNFRYMRWHIASMARYFRKHMGRLPKTNS